MERQSPGGRGESDLRLLLPNLYIFKGYTSWHFSPNSVVCTFDINETKAKCILCGHLNNSFVRMMSSYKLCSWQPLLFTVFLWAKVTLCIPFVGWSRCSRILQNDLRGSYIMKSYAPSVFLRDPGIEELKGREEKVQVKSIFVGVRFICDGKFKLRVN